MTRYAVLGAGLMGRVVAKDLLQTEEEATVTLLDSSNDRLNEAALLVDDERLTLERLDVQDRTQAVRTLGGHTVAIGALPHARSLESLKLAIAADVPMVDLVGSYPELRVELDPAAREASLLIVPGCGVAPGLSNVLVARGVELLDEAHEAVIYVGGIPRRRRPPLEYETVYSLESMFGAFLRPARIWVDGAMTTAEPLSGLELLDFPEPVGTLEAFYTDGLASLPLTMTGSIRDSLTEKTLRYPGFAERVGFLKECGLLERNPVQVGAVEVAPVELLIRQTGPALELGPEGDILVMRVVVKGMAGGRERLHTFDLVDFMDPATGDTAMARTTGFTATVAARLIASGGIAEVGVRFPEQLFLAALGDALLSGLAARGVVVRHSVE
jgi:lysine 6-dehydrogenase